MTQKIAIALSADKMGAGDEGLGKILIKGFVFALTQQDILPDVIVLYNKGALLSAEGSPVLADLISLEKAGVRVLTCGTCLEYFGITDRLAVGKVSDMYTIVGEMCGADEVLRP